MSVLHKDTICSKLPNLWVFVKETARPSHAQRKQPAMNKCDFTAFSKSKGPLC